MKRRPIYLPALFCFWFVSCASPAPDDAVFMLFIRAQDAYREGFFTEAAILLRDENKFVPAVVLRGKAEFLSNNPIEAERSLRRALHLKPGDYEASLFLARILREKGETNEAQSYIDRLLGENAMDIRALRLAAELAGERGLSGDAAALLDRAVEASAESALVFLDRARLRWTGGNRTGALEDLGRARVLLPPDSPVLRAVETLESIIRGVS